MSDLNVSISQLVQGKSGEKEVFRAVNTLRDQALLRFETTATTSTPGDGVYKTIWSATIPNDSSWWIDTVTIGRGTSGGASFEKCLGIQNFAGTVTVIGGSSQGTFLRVDAVGMASQFSLTGALLAYQVRDDGVQPMSWKVFVTAMSVT